MTRVLLGPVLLVCATLMGCGGSGGRASASSDADQIREVGEQAANALKAKDWGELCNLTSPRVKDRLRQLTDGQDCETSYRTIGEGIDSSSIRSDTSKLTVTGDKAIAKDGEISDAGRRDAYFERVDGRWLLAQNESE